MENTISKHAASMAPTNTIITTEIMANHSHHWQALLECIADYLRDGPGVWWRKLNNDAIEFYDVSFPTNNSPPNNPTLKNFRSASIIQISAYLKSQWSECIQEKVTLPADTLHLDKSNSSADENICEDDQEEDAHIHVVSISEIETDLFSCKEQAHNTEIHVASKGATSNSEPDQQISAETNPLTTTLKRHCTGVMGPSTQTDTQEHAQSSSHTHSDTPHSQASQGKRYKTKTHLISSRHTAKTSTPVSAAARTLKTKMGKGLAKLFGERDEDIIALDDIRDSMKSKRAQELTQKYNMLESQVSSRVLRLLSEINKEINAWEMDFLTMNKALPSSSDVTSTPEISLKYRKRHLAKELLSSFQITVHV